MATKIKSPIPRSQKREAFHSRDDVDSFVFRMKISPIGDTVFFFYIYLFFCQ